MLYEPILLELDFEWILNAFRLDAPLDSISHNALRPIEITELTLIHLKFKQSSVT